MTMTNNHLNKPFISSDAIIPDSVIFGPFCIIGQGVTLGENVVLGAGCILSDGVAIGDGTVLGHYVTVDHGAYLGDECQIGNHVSVGVWAKVGARTKVGDHTTIYPQVDLGEDGFIGSNASIGRLPKAAATSTVKAHADLPPLRIGKGYTAGCSVTLYAGTSYGDKVFIGDGALVRERCTIGQNVVIGSGVAVENDTRIGEFTKIQTGSYITAYMEIEDHVFIAPMVTTTNDNFMGRTEKRFQFIKGAHIGRGARVGGASILLPGVEVAPETFIAAGALVTKDTAESRVMIGFPARDVRQVPDEELLP